VYEGCNIPPLRVKTELGTPLRKHAGKHKEKGMSETLVVGVGHAGRLFIRGRRGGGGVGARASNAVGCI